MLLGTYPCLHWHFYAVERVLTPDVVPNEHPGSCSLAHTGYSRARKASCQALAEPRTVCGYIPVLAAGLDKTTRY
jgi:hypothetical protein